ncbi:hypothetical protein QBZ16_000259 [Prototheca wickerhamii]|uniref:peptidylglycine monooxygenase n=1 Tax=Prototheca wickerhamii TaxID=3111 RepID=A0AAD9IKY3_PROWI|nr:hypothetical protein QBZ16_000259 [Prototheca wickerhamii]
MEEDSYLCTIVPLPANQSLQLVEFTPLAEASRVHHMLLFGCAGAELGRPEVWDCKMAKACPSRGVDNVLYGWGRNASPVALPEGAGVAVGAGTSMPVLVLQIHYLQPRPIDDAPAGLRLGMRRGAQPLAAGVWSFASRFSIPPGKPSYLVQNECCYAAAEPAVATAARVHTHAMGRRVSLELSSPGSAERRLAYAQDPLLPQGFYAMPGPQGGVEAATAPRILPGDRLRMTCDFDSTGKSAPVEAGHGAANEMCNLYLLFVSRLPQFAWCVDGAPAPSGAVARGAVAARAPADWAPPDGLGQAGGLALDHEGRLFAFMRAGREWTAASVAPGAETDFIQEPVLHLLDERTGRVLDGGSIAGGLFSLPHMVTRSLADGTLWLTDVAAHVAVQARLERGAGNATALRVLRELGVRGAHGDGSDARLCRPTQVAVARDGTVYVGDGYCAGRVAAFDGASGALIASFVLPGGAPLRLPHSLAIDECAGTLFVAEREAGFVRAFDRVTGELRGSWDVNRWGLPYALRLGPYGALHALAWDRRGSGATTLLVLGAGAGEVVATVPLPGLASAALAAVTHGMGEEGHTDQNHADQNHAVIVIGGGPPRPFASAVNVKETVATLDAAIQAARGGAGREQHFDAEPEARVAASWVPMPDGFALNSSALLSFAAGLSLLTVGAFLWRSGSLGRKGWARPSSRPRIISL